jgi:formylmethanofuran dehydrogenase subunit E
MRRWTAILFLVAAAGCGGTSRQGPVAEDPLALVAAIHGGAGPWAVAGYRMGRYALARLGLERQSFDLEVVHRTPEEVQYSCIADGASAATGASVGKLNLRLVAATQAEVATTYRRKSTGQTVTLRPTRAFAERFRDVQRERLGEAGRAVLTLPDADVFEEVSATDPLAQAR